MKIECYLQRAGGTHVKLDETIYHFAPSKTDPRHTADITDKQHIQQFLKVDEAYRIADDEKPAPAAVKKADPAPVAATAPAK